MKQLEISLNSCCIKKIRDCLCYADQDIVLNDDVSWTVTKVLHKLREMELCTIYNYYTLEILARSLDCNDAIKAVEAFTEYKNAAVLNLLEVPESEYENLKLKLSNNRRKLVIKCEIEKIKFADETVIRRAMCNCFELQKDSILFVEVEEGCIALTYRISNKVKKLVLNCEVTVSKAKSLCKESITQIIIDDEMRLSVEDHVCV